MYRGEKKYRPRTWSLVHITSHFGLLLFRFSILSREKYAFSVGKYNIAGIPGNRWTNVLVYFLRSNEITVMLHFTHENVKNRSEILRATQHHQIIGTSRITSLVSLNAKADNTTFAVPTVSGQYNVTQCLVRLCIREVKTAQNILLGFI